MMSLPRRQFNLIGITDPVYRFGQSGGRNPRGNAQLSPSRFPRILFSVEVRLRRISAAFEKFCRRHACLYRFTFGKLVGRFLRRRPCEQNAVAGIGGPGILRECVFVKNLFEKKK
jgi:hypothetical protein